MGQFLEPLAHGVWPEMGSPSPCSSLPEAPVEECPKGGETNFLPFLFWLSFDYLILWLLKNERSQTAQWDFIAASS